MVHAVQSRHAADPHLQAEWAAILVAEGRLADAMQHYQVDTFGVSALEVLPDCDRLPADWSFMHGDRSCSSCSTALQAAGVMFTGQHAQQAGAEVLMDLGLKRPMTAEDKAAASASAFDAALQLRPNPHSLCALLQSKCSALGWLHSASASHASVDTIARLHEACLQELQQRHCAHFLV